MPVFIGMLMLFGIVAKNSILLIDFALEEMDKGVDSFAAIMDAGHKRAQPIVMTTVAMVAGMVPTAMSLSGDAIVARADGHRRDRRPDPVDPADPVDRAGELQPGGRDRASGSGRGSAAPADLSPGDDGSHVIAATTTAPISYDGEPQPAD